MFYVDYTHGDITERIAQEEVLDQACSIAESKKKELQSTGKSGIITVYEITNERGMPMEKVYQFMDLKEE